MKKLILTLFMTFFLIACKAQQIIDMSANNNIDGKYLNGSYYHKDVNNYLDSLSDNWSYTFNTSKEFRIILEKVEMVHRTGSLNYNYYTDGFSLRYELYDNGTLTYQSPLIDFAGGSIESSKEIYLSFRDFGRLGAPFSLKLTLEPAMDSNGRRTEKLRFMLSKFEAENPYHEANPNEPYFSVPNNILMTRM